MGRGVENNFFELLRSLADLGTALFRTSSHLVDVAVESSESRLQRRQSDRLARQTALDTDNLHQSIKSQTAAIPTIDEAELNNRFTHKVMEYEVARNGRYPSMALWKSFTKAMWELFGQERIGYLEEPDFSDPIATARYRDQLAAQAELLKNPAATIDVFVEAAALSFTEFMHALPSAAFSMDKQGLEHPGLADVPILDITTDLPVAVINMLHHLFSETANQHGLFKGLYDRLIENQEDAPVEFKKLKTFKGTNAELVNIYLKNTPLAEIFNATIPFDIPLSRMMEHCVLVAGSGHGKTQTLGALISRYLRDDDPPAMVVLDSTGSLVGKLQKLAIFQERLWNRIIIIDPEHSPVPALNPFDISNPRFNAYDSAVRERLQGEVINLFNYVFSTLKNPLTARMETAFAFMVRLLLSVPNANIHTLLELLDDDPPKGDYDQAKFKPFIEKLDPTTKHFFQVQYYTGKDGGLKEQIRARVFDILKEPAFERMFSTVNKVDLFDHMNRGSIILVNTSENLLKDSSATFGRYIIARVMAAAFERAVISERERKETLLIIDEAAPYFDDTFEKLLTRVRQFRLGVCVAFQHMEQASEKLRSAIASNTSVKLAGGLGYTDSRWLARDMEATPEFLKQQHRHSSEPPQWTQLACHVRNFTPSAVSLKVPFFALERMPQMSALDYQQLMEVNRVRVSKGPVPADYGWPDPKSPPDSQPLDTTPPEPPPPPEPSPVIPSRPKPNAPASQARSLETAAAEEGGSFEEWS